MEERRNADPHHHPPPHPRKRRSPGFRTPAGSTRGVLLRAVGVPRLVAPKADPLTESASGDKFMDKISIEIVDIFCGQSLGKGVFVFPDAETVMQQLVRNLDQERRNLDERDYLLRALSEALSPKPSATPPTNGSSFETAAIVAARSAYGFYIRHGAYVCQPYRTFRDEHLTHLGFYCDSSIQPEIPKIIARRQGVNWTPGNAAQLRSTGKTVDAQIADLIESTIASRERDESDKHDVFLLTPHDHLADGDALLVLPKPIAHDNRKHNYSAWTRKHRYVYLDVLRDHPATTDELNTAQHEAELRHRMGR